MTARELAIAGGIIASLAGLALAYSRQVAAAPAGTSGGKLSVAEVAALANTAAAQVGGVDPLMLRAMVEIESSRQPGAFRSEPAINDASVGLMQTLRATARDMWDKGFRAFPKPDYSDLLNPATSMYFGAAYVAWLKSSLPRQLGRAPTEEEIVRCYNGGPKGYLRSATLNHWTKYQAAKARLLGGAA